MTAISPGAGPDTHYQLFAGLRDSGAAYLVTGATALVLHGVPRLTPDVDLVVEAGPANTDRLEHLLATWGYSEPAPAATTSAGVAARRFGHPRSALGAIDIVPLANEAFAHLLAGAAIVTLVDVGIPVVGATDLYALKTASGTGGDRQDADDLGMLAAIHAGAAGSDADTRREQIRKFSRWSIAARLDWLLAAARLARGLAPEAKPMTRGLVRRHGWYGH